MSWLKTNNLARSKNRVWSVALLALVTALPAAPRSTSQAMQKGISVELAPTSSAVPVRAMSLFKAGKWHRIARRSVWLLDWSAEKMGF